MPKENLYTFVICDEQDIPTEFFSFLVSSFKSTKNETEIRSARIWYTSANNDMCSIVEAALIMAKLNNCDIFQVTDVC